MAQSEQLKQVAVAMRRLEVLNRETAFDPSRPDSKPTPLQQQVFDEFGVISQQWIRAGNQSGKSATCARLVSWVVNEQSPVVQARRAEKDPKKTWGSEPLLILIAGRTGKQIEDSLWPKIKGFLHPGTFKEVRLGNILQRVEILSGPGAGNRIVFQSLENPSVARERLMSYVAHVTWCDELPPTMDLVRELLVRTQARNGYSLWSFTPTVVAVEIQKYVDQLVEPEGKVYRFHMLDNPLYSDPIRKAELLARYSHLPADQQDAIFKGEWLSGEDQVYYFHYDKMVGFPSEYSPLWRHLESVDPALSSALGYTLWAEDPKDGIWYCVKAKYITGIYVPTVLVMAVQQESAGVNIVRRVSDPHEVWFIQQAAAMGLNYVGVYKKNDRKADLIKQLQEFLGSRVKLMPHNEDLIGEFQTCRWSDKTEGKIINASRFHLLDSAQYACDNLPKREKVIQSTSHHDWLYQKNEERKQKKEKIEKAIEKRMTVRRGRRRA